MRIFARHAFLRDSGWANCCVLQYKTCLGRQMGKVCRTTGPGRSRSWSDHARVSPAVELTVQASLSQLQVDIFEGGLARNFCFHNSTLQLLSLARDACLLWQRICVLSAPSMRTNLRRHTRIVSICGAIMRHPFSC